MNKFKSLIQTNYTNGTFFETGREIFYARAPGRLDLMGGIADYSGSLVLQMPIAESVQAAVQVDPSQEIHIMSLGEGRKPFSMPLADFGTASTPVSYPDACAYFKQSADWAAYIAGAFLVLMREQGIKFKQGARILLRSDVPEGKGVSSSAAVEAAAMLAICRAFGIQLSGIELATLCQKVENLVAHAPCGIMDQMAVINGRANQLLALKCQPAEILGHIKLPADLAVWGLDSGIRHAVSGSDYGSVRIGSFMGLKILQSKFSFAPDRYLAKISPALFEREFMYSLPGSLLGKDFLETYGELPDTVTSVDPDKTYSVYHPTAHPIYENDRIKKFRKMLAGTRENKGPYLGEWMFESHLSYSKCGLGSEGTDLIVELVRQIGLNNGLFGAKITGGGSGGTVAILGRADAEEVVNAIAKSYERQTGRKTILFKGSSDGAMAI